jgi:hypothetical protein
MLQTLPLLPMHERRGTSTASRRGNICGGAEGRAGRRRARSGGAARHVGKGAGERRFSCTDHREDGSSRWREAEQAATRRARTATRDYAVGRRRGPGHLRLATCVLYQYY